MTREKVWKRTEFASCFVQLIDQKSDSLRVVVSLSVIYDLTPSYGRSVSERKRTSRAFATNRGCLSGHRNLSAKQQFHKTCGDVHADIRSSSRLTRAASSSGMEAGSGAS